MQCPVCGGRAVGKVGMAQYFCSECCIEFKVGKSHCELYKLDPDGGLVRVTEEELKQEFEKAYGR